MLLLIVPVVYGIFFFMAGIDVRSFNSEEGNMLIYIVAAILLLVVFDLLYKRHVKGLGFFSGVTLLIFCVMSSLLAVLGAHV